MTQTNPEPLTSDEVQASEELEKIAESEATAAEVVEDLSAVLTADLQRLQAEYANYRKRVDRDRALSHEISIAGVLNEFLPVLDDLDRAHEHGELTGGFKAIADQIQSITTKLGLVKYGEAPSPFDPNIHDALLHETSTEVTETTVTKILQPGYKHKERILRPARVAVTDPQE